MRRGPLPALLATLAFLLLSTDGADSAPGAAPGDVVLRVGGSTVSTQVVGERFSRLRGFQRASYGTSHEAQLRAYVDRVMVRDMLLAERGKQSGILDSGRVRAQQKLIMGDALVSRLRTDLERSAPITEDEIKAYYEAHPELFRVPERIRILRLLVDEESEAARLIERAGKLPSMDDWRNLVREKSKDRATSERGGDLGFVTAQGTTDVPELEVDPALYVAAQKVKDGQIVAQPVPEGKRFAVVWRRGSVAEKVLSLSTEAPRIRVQLQEERLETKLRELIANLRREHLVEHYPVRLNGRDFPQEQPSSPSPSPTGSSQPSTAR